MLPSQFGKDRAVRERNRPFAIILHGYGVFQDRPRLVQAAGLLGRGNQFPLPVSRRGGDAVDWRNLFGAAVVKVIEAMAQAAIAA